jgi:hypothetical protein
VLEAAGRRLAIGFEDYSRPTAANYWGRVKKAYGLAIGRDILGERWARDHADDKKPVLAAALEAAFDINKSTACIGLGHATRDTAAAWLPPGMAYGDRSDADDGETPDIDVAAAELPAFLTEDESGAAGLNGAAALWRAFTEPGYRAPAGARSPACTRPPTISEKHSETPMTDTIQTPASAPLDDVRARNKTILVAALAEAGIHRVIVDYDGSGDSGQIENVGASNIADERMPFPSEARIQLGSESPDRPPSETNLESAIENLAWDCLESSIGWGWENNDGAFGTFVFDVPGGLITLEHSERYSNGRYRRSPQEPVSSME